MAAIVGFSEGAQAQPTPPAASPGRGRGRGRSGRGRQHASPVGVDSVSAESGLSIGSPSVGVIDNVRETFGFLRTNALPEALFFHCTEVLIAREGHSELVPISLDEGRVDLGQHLRAGDKVELRIGPGQRGSRFTAKQVKVVAQSSEATATQPQASSEPLYTPAAQADAASPQPSERASAKTLQGTITQMPSISPANWRARQEALDGRLTFYAPGADTGPEGEISAEELPFGSADLSSYKGRLQAGDVVTFVLSERWEGKRATKLQLVPGLREKKQAEQPTDAPRLQGFVYTFNHNSGRGSIRRADGEGQLGFSINGVVEASRVDLTHTSEVEFVLGKDGRKDVAVAIVCLPAGTLRQEEALPGEPASIATASARMMDSAWAARIRLPGAVRPASRSKADIATAAHSSAAPRGLSTPMQGRVSGRVVRSPVTPQGQSRERPGAIRCDDADLGSVISFSSEEANTAAGGVPGEGDDVEFSRLLRRRSGAVWAVDLALTCRAIERRELGQVAVLKPRFGFLKCCERRGDLFFHFDALAEGLSASDVALGMDVEFSVGLEPSSEDRDTPRAVALRVARAPQGSAVFETVSEARLPGVVQERLQSNGFTTVSSGVLEYEDPASSQKARLTFNADDLVASETAFQPQQGDRVTFRLAMRVRDVRDAQAVGGAAARHAGRRATEVDLQRFRGVCAVWKLNYGFIDVANAQELGLKGRLYFNAGDLGGPAPAVGQHVGGTVASNAQGEPCARSVKVLPAPPVPEATATAQEPAPAPPLQRPKLQLKAASGSEAGKKAPTARIAAGPDGSRGFAAGRGRGILAAPPGITAPPLPPGNPPPKPASSLKLILSGSLNPTASEFVPSATLTRSMSSRSAAAGSDSGTPTAAAVSGSPLSQHWPEESANGHSGVRGAAESPSTQQAEVASENVRIVSVSAEEAAGSHEHLAEENNPSVVHQAE